MYFSHNCHRFQCYSHLNFCQLYNIVKAYLVSRPRVPGKGSLYRRGCVRNGGIYCDCTLTVRIGFALYHPALKSSLSFLFHSAGLACVSCGHGEVAEESEAVKKAILEV